MSVLFDGVNDFAATSANFAFSTNIITLSFWMWWDTYANDDKLALELSTNFNSNFDAFILDPNASGTSAGKFAGTISAGGPTYRQQSITRPSAARWHHYSIILDNTVSTGNLTYWVDGFSQSATTDVNNKSETGNFRTDKLYFMSRAGGSLFGAGKLAYFTIHAGRALTPGEILQNMRYPGSVLKSQKAFWLFLQAGTQYDYSGNGNLVTTTGAITSSNNPPVFLQRNSIIDNYLMSPAAAGGSVFTPYYYHQHIARMA